MRALTHKTRSLGGSCALRIVPGLLSFNEAVAEKLSDFLPIHCGLVEVFDHAGNFCMLCGSPFGLCTALHAASNFVLQPCHAKIGVGQQLEKLLICQLFKLVIRAVRSCHLPLRSHRAVRSGR